MSGIVNCPGCGSPVNDQMKFCRNCGFNLSEAAAAAVAAPVEVPAATVAAAPAPVAPAAPAAAAPTDNLASFEAEVQAAEVQAEAALGATAAAAAAPAAALNEVVCAACGAHNKLGSSFCRGCGSPLPKTEASGAAAPAAEQGGGYASGAMAQNLSRNADETLRANAPVSAPVYGAAPQAPAASPEQITAAFGYFGKTYSPTTQGGADAGSLGIHPRREAEAGADEGEAAELDYSVRSGSSAHVSYGVYAADLSDDVIPVVGLVDGAARDKGRREEAKNRLKHKVALGEMSQRDAVAAADSQGL